MRVLILFRGAPGCGKSTFIDNLGWRSYALSADEIRQQYSNPRLNVNGDFEINTTKIEKMVWDTLFQMLDVRMENGDFTVIDATNSKAEEMNRYKKMADRYKYRIYLIDMTSIPIAEVKNRNANRTPSYKRVPDEVIDKMYARFKTQSVPSGIKIIPYTDSETIYGLRGWTYRDLSEYNEIIHIGDIHGCYDVLMKAIGNNGELDDHKFYIFCGDYLDRGIQNVEVMNYLLSIFDKPNVVLLEGNHERWLWYYAENIEAKSKEFAYKTAIQLEKAGIKRSDVSRLYKKCAQLIAYKYDDTKVLVTHGGIPKFINSLAVMEYCSKDIIHGVGKYEDHQKVDEVFANNIITKAINLIQIHGHRNVLKSDIKSTERTYNLEGEVEFGGYLRTVTISHAGIKTEAYKNDVYDENRISRTNNTIETTNSFDVINENNVDITVEALVTSFRADRKNIMERKFGNISSFNFSRDAFMDRRWNNRTIKARGLYINTDTNTILCRGYEKFFKVNEIEETKIKNLERKLVFPVTAYIKENGYLGLVSYNSDTDELFFTTKSNPTGDYAVWFKEIFTKLVSEELLDKLKYDMKLNNYTLACEVIDQTRDPHIIKYDIEKDIYLLAAIDNTINFNQASYINLKLIGETLGLKVKREVPIKINTWVEFVGFFNEVTKKDYKYEDKYVEGFVLEDSNGYMLKIKSDYYDFWKHMRSIVPTVFKNGYIQGTSSLYDDRSNNFYGYLRKLYKETPNCKEVYKDTSIIQLRDQYELYMKEE